MMTSGHSLLARGIPSAGKNYCCGMARRTEKEAYWNYDKSLDTHSTSPYQSPPPLSLWLREWQSCAHCRPRGLTFRYHQLPSRQSGPPMHVGKPKMMLSQ